MLTRPARINLFLGAYKLIVATRAIHRLTGGATGTRCAAAIAAVVAAAAAVGLVADGERSENDCLFAAGQRRRFTRFRQAGVGIDSLGSGDNTARSLFIRP